MTTACLESAQDGDRGENVNGRALLEQPRPGHGGVGSMSSLIQADPKTRSVSPFKRHKTRHRGITYRIRADGSRLYFVYAQGRQHSIEGGEREAVAKQAELRGKVARGERIAPA